MRGKTKTRGLVRPAWCRMFALILMISTVVASIPERAFAETVTNEVSTVTNEEETAPAGGNSGSAIVLPEEWRGLGYAVYTGGDKSLSLYTWKTSIVGDVHTNKDFYYQGTSLLIKGDLEASGMITTNTSSEEGCLQIDNKVENASNIDMPFITQEIYDHIKDTAQSYDSDKTFDSNRVAVINPIYVNGRTTFNATEFLGKGIIYSKDSITYNVGSIATPDDSRILLCAENGDITLNGSEINMNAILYAPNGTVYVNANNFNLNGRIIAKQVCINGSIIKINATDADFELIDFILKPELSITVEGNQKVNRKVSITLAELGSTNYVKEDTVTWKIYKDNVLADELYRIDEEASTYLKKELLFKEAGNYVVQIDVKRGNIVYTEQKEFTIVEDLPPIANLELEKKEYTRNKDGIATIKAKDLSYSPDNDTIANRIWTIYYDSNNDGIYGKDEVVDTITGETTELSYETKKVGKYKVELEVKEYFEDTIPKLLTDADYLRGNTSAMQETDKSLEIVNTAPEATIDIEKKKFADIVFTIGNAPIDKINTYSAKIKELEQTLKDNNIDAKISTVSTSTLTAEDQFAWKEYDHYNYKDQHLPTLAKHIIYNKTDIKMLGYSVAPLKDFLYVADDNAGQKIFEFDIQRDATDWHSMEGGGFLFNTTVSDEKNSIKGFCILITQAGLKLVQIDCNNLSGFRNGSYKAVQNAGKILNTYSIPNVYSNHHLKIVVDAKTISVFDGDTKIIDSYVLPDNNYGYGFGPIISHASHACSQQSYFTFKNITMQTVKGSSLSDIINGFEWRENASHFVINLSNDSVPELEEDEKLASIAESLLENEAPFIGLGTTKNHNQYLDLISTSQTGGMFLENDNLNSAMDNANQYILDSILAKDYTIKDYITSDDVIDYIKNYSDAENDEIYEENWEYEYDPTVFGESKDETQLIIKKGAEPITKFDQTGAYAIRLRVRDNPVGDNDALDKYRLWSGNIGYDRHICVQTRPTADVKVEVLKDTTDATKCTVTASYNAEDKDHPSDDNKGIREELFYYKNIKDGEWTEGQLPNKVDIGQTYLIKYVVRDVEGTYSKPAIGIVKTSEFKQNKVVIDSEIPDIFINTTKEVYQVGEEIRIDGYAIDNYGVDKFELYINGEVELNTPGRVILNPVNEETLSIVAKAVDIYGNSAEKEMTIQVVDTSDKIAPTIEITSPNADADLGSNISFIGTIKDESILKQYSISYRKEGDENYSIAVQGTEQVEGGELGQLDISKLDEGVYEILITAEDEAGNLSYYGMTLNNY
ncbi:hypothetical protein [Anaerosporobacter sp.]